MEILRDLLGDFSGGGHEEIFCPCRNFSGIKGGKMKNLLIATLASMTMFVMIGAAQDVNPPVFDQSPTAPTVTISAGDSHCIFFRLPGHDDIFIQCFRGQTEVLDTRMYPPKNQSVMGSLVLPKSSYSWILSQPSNNVFTWQVTANGSTQSGTF
jgi:hypothetical protein